ncbi:MAG: hypothetical protein MUE69_20295 [Myxococcota bacterium]|jgi:hypothetical protein|nr:hypothetical protein [Myxococcota bacterium]
MTMGVTARELVEKLRARDQRLPFEIGAFVALETIERLLDGPAVVRPDDVRIGPEGTLAIYVAPHSASGPEAAKSVAGLMAHLLVAAGAGVPPGLLRLVENGPSDGRWDPARLRDELEASLVPLNRAAARRVLSRIVRDLENRPRPSSRPPNLAQVGQLPGDVDDDLDALLAVGEPDEDEDLPTSELPQLDQSGNPVVPFAAITAKRTGLRKPLVDELDDPLASEHDRPTPAVGHDVKALGRAVDARREQRMDETPALAAVRPVPPREPTPSSSRQSQPSPGARELQRPATKPVPLDALDGFDDEPRPKKSGLGLGIAAVIVLIVGGLAAVAVLRPDVVDRVMGRAPSEDELRAEEEARMQAERAAQMERAAAELRARYGRLSIRVEGHERAQIFLFVGRGPAAAENLPTGLAHELVAIADGRSPTRAVVPADATWTPSDDGLLYELAMQTGDQEMAFEQLVLGPTRLDRNAMGTPSGELGRVRVITTPPGARVFLLVGFGTTEIRDLPTDAPQEILVYDEGVPPVRSFVGPSDWREGPEGKEAELVVTLPEPARRR